MSNDVGKLVCVAMIILTPPAMIIGYQSSQWSSMLNDAKKNDRQTGYCYHDTNLLWGSTPCVTRSVADNNMAIVYDLSNNISTKQIINLNKSKMIGGWVKRKGSEFIKGFKEN